MSDTDNLIAEARAELIRTGDALAAHRDAKRSRERVEEATDMLRIFRQGEANLIAILDRAALGAVRPAFPVDGAPMGGDPSEVVRGAVRSDVASSAPILATSPGYGKPVAVQPVTPDRRVVAWFLWCANQGYLTDEDRDILDNWFLSDSANDHPDDNREVWLSHADALLVSGVLGQPSSDVQTGSKFEVPQPQPNREALKPMLDAAWVKVWGFRSETRSHTEEMNARMFFDRGADALLPLLGQPRTDAPLDPEPWEYGAAHHQGINPCSDREHAEREVERFAARDDRIQLAYRGRAALMRRRPAGPWVPVEQDQARYPRTDTGSGREA